MQTALHSAQYEHSLSIVMPAGLNPEREEGVLGMQTWKSKGNVHSNQSDFKSSFCFCCWVDQYDFVIFCPGSGLWSRNVKANILLSNGSYASISSSSNRLQSTLCIGRFLCECRFCPTSLSLLLVVVMVVVVVVVVVGTIVVLVGFLFMFLLLFFVLDSMPKLVLKLF